MDSTTSLWIAILGAAVATFAIRISFLGPWARGQFPAWLARALTYAPPVIFAALIAPMVFGLSGSPSSATRFAQIAATATTLGLAVWRGGQLLPIIAGMLVLHAVQFIAGSL